MTRAVVVTRDEPRDGPLSASLRGRGLEVLWWPVVRIGPPADARPLEEALGRAAEFDWIVLTSRHAVETVASRLAAPPARVRIAAVGAATAEALRERGWSAAVVPRESGAAALVSALTPHLEPGSRVLFPASSRALPTIAAELRRLGAQVCQVEAYRNEAAAPETSTWEAAIEAGKVGAVTFTSPSCVEELEHALGRGAFERLLAGARHRSACAVALGPTTAQALSARGIEPALAEPATLEGLAEQAHRILIRMNGR